MRNVMLLLASVAVAAMVGVGCKKSSGNTDPGSASGGGGDADAAVGARDYFMSKVFPVISRTCGGCHAGQGTASTFLAPNDASSSYNLISAQIGYIADPGKSPLVQHIHTDKNVALSPEERNVLTQWLNMEASARGLAGAIQKAANVQTAYKQFADCMNFDVWEYYRAGDLPFTQTDVDGPCMGCHSTGQGSAWMSAASRETFEKAKEFPFIQKFVVGKVDAAGNFDSLVPANRFAEKANEVCTKVPSTECHPGFGLPPNVTNAIDMFVTTTLQNMQAGTCDVFTPLKDAGPPDANDGGGK
jgi:hypothetical protein